MVTRRLDAEERLAFKSGCVYAWEERLHSEITDLGFKHFTEGLRWSSSYNLLHPTLEANLFLLQNLGISFLL
jgi:hypothetical protein